MLTMENRYLKTNEEISIFIKKIGRCSSQNRLRGYYRKRDGCVEALLQGTLRALDDIRNAIDFNSDENGNYLLSDKFSSLTYLPEANDISYLKYLNSINSNLKASTNDFFSITKVTSSNSKLTGFSICSKSFEFKPFYLVLDDYKVYVDTPVFSSEHLKAGHPNGLVAFSFTIPLNFLTGKKRNVILNIDDFIFELDVFFPFIPSTAKPWQSCFGEFQEIKNEIMHGNIFRGKEMMISYINDNPAGVFLDFGFKEKYMSEDSYFQNFRDRISDRSYLWHSKHFCSKQDCCKQVGLGLNNIIEKAGRFFKTTDPDVITSYCAFWPRYLASKMFIKEYGKKFGLKTPKTYGFFSNIDEINWNDLPDRYVLKPDASSGLGLYLMNNGINLFDGKYYSNLDIEEAIKPFLSKGHKVIVEEFLTQEGCFPDDPYIPLDYKVHVFGGKARIIHIDDRNNVSRDKLKRWQGWYSADWSASPHRFRHTEVEYYGFKKPDLYNEMIDKCEEIARHFGDYVRIDLYLTDKGVYLGELSHTTHNGVGFTPFGDYVFSQLWELFPGPIITNSDWSKGNFI